MVDSKDYDLVTITQTNDVTIGFLVYFEMYKSDLNTPLSSIAWKKKKKNPPTMWISKTMLKKNQSTMDWWQCKAINNKKTYYQRRRKQRKKYSGYEKYMQQQ